MIDDRRSRALGLWFFYALMVIEKTIIGITQK